MNNNKKKTENLKMRYTKKRGDLASNTTYFSKMRMSNSLVLIKFMHRMYFQGLTFSLTNKSTMMGTLRKISKNKRIMLKKLIKSNFGN